MSKNNHKKHNFGILLRILLCQTLIAIIFIFAFGASKPPTPAQCVSTEITIEDKAIAQTPGIRRTQYTCIVYAKGQGYHFDGGAFDKYSYQEFYDAVGFGEELTIVYVERAAIWGKYAHIIDARNDQTVYMDLDTYLAEQNTSFVITNIVFALIELIFIGTGTFVYILFHKKTK